MLKLRNDDENTVAFQTHGLRTNRMIRVCEAIPANSEYRKIGELVECDHLETNIVSQTSLCVFVSTTIIFFLLYILRYRTSAGNVAISRTLRYIQLDPKIMKRKLEEMPEKSKLVEQNNINFTKMVVVLDMSKI